MELSILFALKKFQNEGLSLNASIRLSLFKSAFRMIVIRSVSSSQALEILSDGLRDLTAKLNDDLKHLAVEHSSFFGCVDKAGRHAIGEAVKLFLQLDN